MKRSISLHASKAPTPMPAANAAPSSDPCARQRLERLADHVRDDLLPEPAIARRRS